MVYVQKVLALMKICVIIPAYNESLHIAALVDQIKSMKLDVLVIDDGSQDNTAAIAREHGAVVLRNEANQGKGASLKKGFDYTLKGDFDAAVALDGDGQHLPEEIAHFINLAQKSSAAIFVGNRMDNSRNMPLDRYLTNKFMSWLISLVAGQRVPDTQCGYRLIKRELLDKFDLHTANYEIESEMLIQAARRGAKIDSVLIKAVYNGTKSQINPFRDTLRFIRYIFKAAVKK